MKRQAKLENSGISDSQYGKAIFVSTTARLAFRQVNPSYAKVRNDQLNHVIGSIFSQSAPTAYFRPKQGGEEDVGEVREGGGAKFISIISPSHISVLAVKKVPQVPAPVSNIPITTSKKQIMLKKAKYNKFFLEHLYDEIEKIYGLESSQIYNLVEYLKQFHNNDLRETLKTLIKNKDRENVEKLLSVVHQQELSSTMRYDSLHPRSTFSVPQGMPLNPIV